jgi:uncharacterized membrane protein
MFRHPKKSTVKNPFLKPFKQNVWWLTLNISIVCWILLLVTIKIDAYYNSDNRQDNYYNTSSEIALITFAAIAQQGFILSIFLIMH